MVPVDQHWRGQRYKDQHWVLPSHIAMSHHCPPCSAGTIPPPELQQRPPGAEAALTTVSSAPFWKQGWKAMSCGSAFCSPRRNPLEGKGELQGEVAQPRHSGDTKGLIGICAVPNENHKRSSG